MENNQITLEELNAMGVYELRALARSVGVSSPTTKKVSELISEITKIYNRETKPCINNKMGRPPKYKFFESSTQNPDEIPEDILNLNNQNDINAKSNEDDFFKKIVLKQDITKNELCDIVATGFVCITSNGHYYFWQRNSIVFEKTNVVYLPEGIVNANKIRLGDKIVCTCTKDEHDKCLVASKIISINFSEDFLNRNTEELGNVKIPNKSIMISGESIFEGGRNLVSVKNRTNSIFRMFEHATYLNEQGYKTVLLATEVPPEFVALAENHSFLQMFLSRYGDSVENTYLCVINCINFLNSLLQDKNKIVLLVYDIPSILNVLNLYFSFDSKITNSYVNALQLVKTLFGLGRYIDETSSITTLCGVMEHEMNSDLIKNEFQKVSSCTLENIV